MSVDEMIQEAWLLRYSDTAKCIDYADLLIRQGDDRSLAWGRLLKGLGSFLHSRDEQYLDLLFSALDWFSHHRDDFGYAACLYYLGNIYESYGNYDEALSYATQGLDAAESMGFREGQGDALAVIGMIHFRIGNQTMSVENYEKCLQIRRELKNEPAVASVLNQMARCYAEMNDIGKAEEFYHKSLALRKTISDDAGIPWTHLGLGALYEKAGRDTQAAEHYTTGMQLNKESGDFRYDIQASIGLARIALRETQYGTALELLSNALGQAEQLNAKPLQYEIHFLLSELKEKEGKTKEALAHFRTFHRLREEVISAETQRRIHHQQYTYNLEKTRREAEIIHLRNVELKEALETIQHINKDITDSISYAFRIQRAVLPPYEKVRDMLPESFIFWRPRDIVSGDFYFCEKQNNKIVFSAIDCTGHGVPGALLSIAGFGLLSQAVNERNYTRPCDILRFLDEGINQRFHMHYKEDQVKDAMDISICSLDIDTLELQYAGAYNALYYVREGELFQIKADSFPIGVNTDGVVDDYTHHSIRMQKGDCVYLFTDGYADQFGGPKGKKFMYKQLRELLASVSPLSADEQKMKIETAFDSWKAGERQVDDVLIFGVKII